MDVPCMSTRRFGVAAVLFALCAVVAQTRSSESSHSPAYLLDQPNGLQIELTIDYMPSWRVLEGVVGPQPVRAVCPTVHVPLLRPPLIVAAVRCCLLYHPAAGFADPACHFCHRLSGRAPADDPALS